MGILGRKQEKKQMPLGKQFSKEKIQVFPFW